MQVQRVSNDLEPLPIAVPFGLGPRKQSAPAAALLGELEVIACGGQVSLDGRTAPLIYAVLQDATASANIAKIAADA